MCTINRRRQMQQIARLAPDLYADLTRHYPVVSDRSVAAAMHTLFNRLINTTEKLWQSILITIKDQPTLIFNGSQTEPLGRIGNRTITLYRDYSHLRLYDGLGMTSAPIAFLGQDFNHISGPKSIWKLIDDSPAYNPGDGRKVFDNFINHRESSGCWRKTGFGWQMK